MVGDNGSGKSTVVEAMVAAGFNAEGGSRNLRFSTYRTHSELAEHVRLAWSSQPRWGWFLRAATFYGMATHIVYDDDPDAGGDRLGSRTPDHLRSANGGPCRPRSARLATGNC